MTSTMRWGTVASSNKLQTTNGPTNAAHAQRHSIGVATACEDSAARPISMSAAALNPSATNPQSR